MISQKIGQIVLVAFDVESEMEILWIHFSDVQIGNISHDAYGESHIEVDKV